MEIKEIDGRRAADTVLLFLLVPALLAVPVLAILFACGVKITNAATWTDLLFQGFGGLLWLGSLWVTIRMNCWIYNKLADRFGGLRFWTQERADKETRD